MKTKMKAQLFALFAVFVMVATCFTMFAPSISSADDEYLVANITVEHAPAGVSVIASSIETTREISGVTDSQGKLTLELPCGYVWKIKSSSFEGTDGITYGTAIKYAGQDSSGSVIVKLQPNEKFIFLLAWNEDGTFEYYDNEKNDLKDATPISNTNTSLNTVTSVGSWTELQNKLLKQCYYATFDASGHLHEMLDSNDLTVAKKWWDNETESWVTPENAQSSIRSENTMFCIPTIYWSCSGNGILMTNDADFYTPEMPRTEAYAHTIDDRIYEFLAIGVYEGTVNGNIIKSISGVTPNPISNTDNYESVRTYVKNNGAIMDNGHSLILNLYQWSLWKNLCVMASASLNVDSIINNSSTSAAVTGQTDKMGMFAGSKSSGNTGKFFVENLYGNDVDIIGDTAIDGYSIYAAQTSDQLKNSDKKLIATLVDTEFTGSVLFGNKTSNVDTSRYSYTYSSSSGYASYYNAHATYITSIINTNPIPTNNQNEFVYVGGGFDRTVLPEVYTSYYRLNEGAKSEVQSASWCSDFKYGGYTLTPNLPGERTITHPTGFNNISANYGMTTLPTNPSQGTIALNTTAVKNTARLAFVYDQTQPVYSNPYKVTFNGNGGTPQVPEIEGNGITLPTATMDGKIFMGWYTAADDSGEFAGAAGVRYYPPSDITLYAHWSTATYRITLEAGEHGTITPATIDDVPHGTTYSVRNEVLTIGNQEIRAEAEQGYTIRWTVNGEPITASGEITSATAFKAEFTLTYYTVTVKANTGGIVTVDAEQTEKIENVAYGTSILKQGRNIYLGDDHIIMATATKGYIFDSWFFTGGQEPTVVTKNITIIATFIEETEEKYTVTLTVSDGIGGTIVETGGEQSGRTTVLIDQVPKDSTITISGNTISINGVSREFKAIANSGYDFNYWDGSVLKVTGNMTINAHFVKSDEKASVDFKADTGGSVSKREIPNTKSDENIQVTVGSVINVSDNKITIAQFEITANANEGYVFDKWVYDSGTAVKTGDKITGNTVIKALFKEDTPGPEPEPEKNDKNIGFMIGMIAGGVIAVVLAGLAIYGIRSPIVFVLMAVAVIVAVAMALLYFGAIKL